MPHERRASTHAPASARAPAGIFAESRASALVGPREASETTMGFLPSRVPTDALPPALMPHVEACWALAARYHRDGADVRP